MGSTWPQYIVTKKLLFVALVAVSEEVQSRCRLRHVETNFESIDSLFHKVSAIKTTTLKQNLENEFFDENCYRVSGDRPGEFVSEQSGRGDDAATTIVGTAGSDVDQTRLSRSRRPGIQTTCVERTR